MNSGPRMVAADVHTHTPTGETEPSGLATQIPPNDIYTANVWQGLPSYLKTPGEGATEGARTFMYMRPLGDNTDAFHNVFIRKGNTWEPYRRQ